MEFDHPRQMVPALVLFGDLIDPEYDFLRRVAQPTWTFVDVGAAIGQFSVFAGRVCTTDVHAFEPSSANVATLRRNLKRNALDHRVTVHQIALSDAPGDATFATGANTYMSRLDRESGGGAEQETVTVDTLTTTCARLGLDHISVLKVNVSGFEPSVLAGADAMLRGGAVDMLILLVGDASLPAFRTLRGYGYRFFYYHPRNASLHDLGHLSESSLRQRPWPARHVIAIHEDAFQRCTTGTTVSARSGERAR